jgi:hypothetical protein
MKLSTCERGLTTRLIYISGGRRTRLLSLAMLSAFMPGFALGNV